MSDTLILRVEFDAIPSGDGESFCWAVDAETFERLEGEKPDGHFVDFAYKGLYQLHDYEPLCQLVRRENDWKTDSCWLRVCVDVWARGDLRLVHMSTNVLHDKPVPEKNEGY